jgi:uncharacterized protein
MEATMPNKQEFRVVETDEVEIRSQGEGEKEQKYVDGYGIVYDREVEIWDGYFEKIRPGAFADVLKSGREVKSFFNHRADFVLATTKSNPVLELEDTDKGLRFKAPIPPTTYGNDLQINLERKNVRGASFTFSVPKDGDIVTRDKNGGYHREIVKAELYEIGPVTNPAYKQTKVGLRSKEEAFAEAEERCKADPPETSNSLQLMSLKLNLIERSI